MPAQGYILVGVFVTLLCLSVVDLNRAGVFRAYYRRRCHESLTGTALHPVVDLSLPISVQCDTERSLATRPRRSRSPPFESKAITLTQQYVCQINSHHHIKVRAPETGYLRAIPIREGPDGKAGRFAVRGQDRCADEEKPDAENEDKVVSIKAPFDGAVDRLSHQQGSLVRKGETLTTLSDNSLMWVYFNVPEARYLEYNAANLAQQQDDLKIELVLANGDKFDQLGKLGAIGADFNSATGNVSFRADFPNPNGLLRHGQTGTMLISRVQKDAIVIPQRAAFEFLDKRYIYVVDKDDVAHRREIVIQNELEDMFVVKTGVGVDDKIVIDGIRAVNDGEKVKYDNLDPMKVVAKRK